MDDNEQKNALVAELGIADFSAEDQEKLLEQFGEVALKAATVAVMQDLPASKQEEFAKLAEAGDTGQLKAFLDSEVPGHERIAEDAVTAEILNFRVALAEEDMAQEDSAGTATV